MRRSSSTRLRAALLSRMTMSSHTRSGSCGTSASWTSTGWSIPGRTEKCPRSVRRWGLQSRVGRLLRQPKYREHAAYSEAFGQSDALSLVAYDSSVTGNHQYVVVELAAPLTEHRNRLVPTCMRKTFAPGSTSGPAATTWSHTEASFHMPAYCFPRPSSLRSASSSSRRDPRWRRMIAVESPTMFSRNWRATRPSRSRHVRVAIMMSIPANSNAYRPILRF